MCRYFCGSRDIPYGARGSAAAGKPCSIFPTCDFSGKIRQPRHDLPSRQEATPIVARGRLDSHFESFSMRMDVSSPTVFGKNSSSIESDSGQLSRRSIRLPEFDYSTVGMYFVTICAFKRRCIFGEIRENKIFLSPLGQIVSSCWIETPQHFPNVKTETCVVMPNHIHGILTIDSKRTDARPQNKPAAGVESFGKPTPGSIPTIVRSFKAAASRLARELGTAKGESIWHKGYYEHVVRNTKEYVEITNYIIRNPARWAEDEDNPNRKLRADNL